MDYARARKLFKDFVEAERRQPVAEVRVIVKSFGWVFCWQTHRFFNTGDIWDGVMGNYPVFVSKEGYICYIHPTTSPEIFLADWAKEQGIGEDDIGY